MPKSLWITLVCVFCLLGAPAAGAQPTVRIIDDSTAFSGLRTVQATYHTRYGHDVPLRVLLPIFTPGRLPWVWRLSPVFWMRTGDSCQPFTDAQPARWHFVYVCAAIDTRSGDDGDHAYGDPEAIVDALQLRRVLPELLGTQPTTHTVLGSSASSVNALNAVALAPKLFKTALIFDAPVDLAARYWQLTPAQKRRTTLDYGGPPVGALKRAYADRSPVAHIPELAASPTDLRFFLSRHDTISCTPRQLPRLLALLAQPRERQGRPLGVALGEWRHGSAWQTYTPFELQRIGIAPAALVTEPVSMEKVTAETTSRTLRCRLH